MGLVSILKASLDEKIAESIRHQRHRSGNDRIDDISLLFGRSYLELLLKENGCLLVRRDDDLVDKRLHRSELWT